MIVSANGLSGVSRSGVRIHFADRGQDFLHWDLFKTGEDTYDVCDCGPFQASVWVGTTVLGKITRNTRIKLVTRWGEKLRLNYPIVRTETIEIPIELLPDGTADLQGAA